MKIQKIIDPMQTIKLHIYTVFLTLTGFISYTFPILNFFNVTLLQFYTLQSLQYVQSLTSLKLKFDH